MKNIDIILRNILWYQKKHNCSIWEAYDAYDEPFHSDYEQHRAIDEVLKVTIDAIDENNRSHLRGDNGN